LTVSITQKYIEELFETRIKSKEKGGLFYFYFSVDKALNTDPNVLAEAWDGDATSQLLPEKYFSQQNIYNI
jgi:hypothetical protein